MEEYNEDALWAEVEIYLKELGESPSELANAAAKRLKAWKNVEFPDLECFPEKLDEC